jgi:hypothetical protein
LTGALSPLGSRPDISSKENIAKNLLLGDDAIDIDDADEGNREKYPLASQTAPPNLKKKIALKNPLSRPGSSPKLSVALEKGKNAVAAQNNKLKGLFSKKDKNGVEKNKDSASKDSIASDSNGLGSNLSSPGSSDMSLPLGASKSSTVSGPETLRQGFPGTPTPAPGEEPKFALGAIVPNENGVSETPLPSESEESKHEHHNEETAENEEPTSAGAHSSSSTLDGLHDSSSAPGSSDDVSGSFKIIRAVEENAESTALRKDNGWDDYNEENERDDPGLLKSFKELQFEKGVANVVAWNSARVIADRVAGPKLMPRRKSISMSQDLPGLSSKYSCVTNPARSLSIFFFLSDLIEDMLTLKKTKQIFERDELLTEIDDATNGFLENDLVKVIRRVIKIFVHSLTPAQPPKSPSTSKIFLPIPILTNIDATCYVGMKRTNEDRTMILPTVVPVVGTQHQPRADALSYFGVYDGHGGESTADYVAMHLHVNVLTSPKLWEHPAQALKDGFINTNEGLRRSVNREVTYSSLHFCRLAYIHLLHHDFSFFL